MSGRELTPHHVIADLLGSGDFPAEIADTDRAAEIILDRLRDAGFVILDARDETARVRFALQRALRVADERAKEANTLRQEVASLRARLGE